MTPEMAMARYYAKVEAAGELTGKLIKIVPDSMAALEVYQAMESYINSLQVEGGSNE
jgi:hypothetical protein